MILMHSSSRTCKLCGKPFKRSRGIYCSKACQYRGLAKRRQTRDDAIQLSSGEWALVSHEDMDLAHKSWVPGFMNYPRFGGAGEQRMHRIVMSRSLGRALKPGEEVDHINGNVLDNRRENLRIASRSENMRNQVNRPAGLTGYIGVSAASKSKKFRAFLVMNYQQVYIGVFPTAQEAAWMRDQYALALHGEFARFNFDYFEVEKQ